ncbi:SH3 domain-containing protein [Devosia sp. A8/3-2]|nr:SH3 domain-containing protein [Devosia sp. A8/3-2]
MKSFRLAIFTAMAATASASIAFAAPATVTTNVNVRSGPSQQTAVLDVLQAGTRVDAQCNSNGWCRVNYGRTSGWVSAAYVSLGGVSMNPKPQPQPQPQPVPLPQPVPGNPGGGWFPAIPARAPAMVVAGTPAMAAAGIRQWQWRLESRLAAAAAPATPAAASSASGL